MYRCDIIITYYVVSNALVTCEIKLFQRLTAAHEYFSTSSINVAEIILKLFQCFISHVTTA